MQLLTVGDSFTYGDELSDVTNAWPFVLGNRLGYEVTNLARPGKSNDYIVKTVVEHADNYDLIVIAWSHFARREFADAHGIYDIWPGNKGNLFTGDLLHRRELIEYTNRHHSDEYLYYRYTLNIILMQSYLKCLNKRFIMLDAFGNTSARELGTDEILNKIDTNNYIGWPSESMMEWTYGTLRGANGHFLEDGHKIVADKIYEYIRHLSWIS